MALNGGLEFKLDDKNLRMRFRKMKNKAIYQEMTNEITQEISEIAYMYAHVDTGEMQDSIYSTPAKGGWQAIGTVGAMSDHAIYEEGRGGDHAFLTNAIEYYEQKVLDSNLQEFLEELINE